MIKDIAVIGPEDKLIFIINEDITEADMNLAKYNIQKFLEEGRRHLIMRNGSVIIVKEGAEILLKEVLSEEIQK